ncbi:MAG: ATP:cob(I)alamin adenosyltransferase [Ferrovum sp. 37-45-19]|jgi:cob(I)alamin adenosyltransferase|uniref:cob(I)yrinic acid a,c-diamide adenosyltransferase n=1 Tax=Ferrovum sp. JA12 TaxID=1356299 RepID=UPI000702E15F|nr:cob(I)yrinic acid a,c-diamide adenosyltransferase [Ferrovum sp. JA12]OYV80179.1 MAG: ATP:cob(I)alamin adenosyltransferase [Ferrovum sp. 21-44-67]OYV94456.1 MAG: ATP:cob(I)alamin adenosyltransferase [Ferrovum sp. 37-45-19]OZB32439.1 MAG: ATP:cob(I)alamin adenosyltransferase [Ferrovum sp. 34-44-207]HQT81647.1 cob(I)yrinic acid a,c-diamide adenosyltransferase [Ferrovaceae bacterium]KRH78858.1 Cob(I)yrinic acid a,c-diamide adenosyltransferase [Ferrovum sp. JA12]
MGNRLTRLYTKTGDAGTTGLGDGSRVDKDHFRVEVMGDIDELNSILGILLSYPIDQNIQNELTQIQHDLFDLGAEMCIPGHLVITEKRVAELEERLDSYNANLSALKEFILPGGNQAAAICHHARTVCRRAERRIVSLSHHEMISAYAMQYINRLSDYLFVIAREINRLSNTPDVLWRSLKTKDKP